MHITEVEREAARLDAIAKELGFDGKYALAVAPIIKEHRVALEKNKDDMLKLSSFIGELNMLRSAQYEAYCKFIECGDRFKACMESINRERDERGSKFGRFAMTEWMKHIMENRVIDSKHADDIRHNYTMHHYMITTNVEDIGDSICPLLMANTSGAESSKISSNASQNSIQKAIPMEDEKGSNKV
jgi:hypothetical protein